MKKTLIASAVAAAALSTSAFAMDPATALAERLDSMPTIYGNIQLVQVWEDDGSDEKSSLVDNGSTLGFKHTHEISPGTTGFFKAEFHFDGDEPGAGLGEKFDEAYIGVKGDFGQIWVGSDDTAYENIDVIDIYEAVGIAGDLAGVQESNTVQYKTPKIGGGLTAQVTYVADDPSGGSQGHVGALSVAYEMDAISVIGAYAMAEGNGEDAFGLAVKAALGDITVAGQYEHEDESDLFAVNAVAAMGKNQFAAGVAFGEDNSNDIMAISAQALHNMSDNMYVYVEALYEDDDSKADETLTLALGATYAF